MSLDGSTGAYISLAYVLMEACILNLPKSSYESARPVSNFVPWQRRSSVLTNFKAGDHPLSCIWMNARATLTVVPIQSGVSDMRNSRFDMYRW